MELEWEQGRQSSRTAAALAGAFLGAALGADCFLAANYLIGGIPAVLCGAAIGFWAVKGGVLLAGKNNQFVTLLALIPALLWGVLVNHLSFALHTAPADPAGIWQAVTKAIAPEVIGDYYLNGLILRTDDAFQASTTQLEDQENGLTYQISLQYGVGEEAAQISLGRTQGENVRCLRPDSEEFLWGMGDNGVTYRYNLRTVQLPHEQTAHTGVALSERGTLIIIECVHDDDTDEELARGTLLYMLENLQFTGPAITEENYQEQLRPAINMGFNYCGQAFFKAPEGMFEYDVFLDTFMPCGGKMTYYDDGISIMTKAHGLRVSAAIVPNEGTAMDVVEQAYQDLKAAGRQYDEQTLFQDAYNEEGNNACRLTVYYDGGRTRVTVLVAIEEREGCYLFKEMTCLPEEVDSEYQAVFKEMETTCGIEVSVMEDLGRHSQ